MASLTRRDAHISPTTKTGGRNYFRECGARGAAEAAAVVAAASEMHRSCPMKIPMPTDLVPSQAMMNRASDMEMLEVPAGAQIVSPAEVPAEASTGGPAEARFGLEGAVATQEAFRISVHVPDLVRAAERGDEGMVQLLLSSGASPNVADDVGLSALHVSAKKGRWRLVCLLLSSDADANVTSKCSGETPLHYACKYGHQDIVQKLLRSRADPMAMSSKGVTPLEYARDKKHGAIVRILETGLQDTSTRQPV